MQHCEQVSSLGCYNLNPTKLTSMSRPISHCMYLLWYAKKETKNQNLLIAYLKKGGSSKQKFSSTKLIKLKIESAINLISLLKQLKSISIAMVLHNRSFPLNSNKAKTSARLRPASFATIARLLPPIGRSHLPYLRWKLFQHPRLRLLVQFSQVYNRSCFFIWIGVKNFLMA